MPPFFWHIHDFWAQHTATALWDGSSQDKLHVILDEDILKLEQLILLKAISICQACCVLVCWVSLVLSDSLWPEGLESSRLLCLWGFSRQKYWSGLLCPPPGDLPDPGIKSGSLMSLLYWQVGSLPLVPPGKSPGLLYFVNILKATFLSKGKPMALKLLSWGQYLEYKIFPDFQVWLDCHDYMLSS